MMKRWWTMALIALAAGCSQPDAAKADACPGGGEVLAVDGDEVCVYDTRQGHIIETGFNCPPDRMTRTNYGDLIVCSDGSPPMSVEDDLEDAYPGADLGGDSCRNVLCDTGETCAAGQCVDDDPNNTNNPMCTPTTEVCGDNVNNDCDDDVDCEDADCAMDVLCAAPPVCPDTNEPNDTTAGASAADVVGVQSALCGAADVDVWSTTANAADQILVTVTLPAQADVTAELVDGAGEPVYSDQAELMTATSADISDGMFVLGGVIRRGFDGPFYVRLTGEESAYEVAVEVTAVPRLTDVDVVGAGDGYSCALHTMGTVYCWGTNDHLQLGDRAIPSSSTPLPLTTMQTATRLWVGPEHACAMMNNEVRCWGDNTYGEVGPQQIGGPVGLVQSTGVSDAVDVVLGRDHTCALASTGAVTCWGRNIEGQLGDATFFGSSDAVPHVVSTIDDATELAAGDSHTCALRADDTVWCWGSTTTDQLCDPMLFDDWTNDPLPISYISGGVTATSISAAGNWTIAHEAGFGGGWGAIPGFDAMGGTGAFLSLPSRSAFDPAPAATQTWAGANSWCRAESAGIACMAYGPFMNGNTLLSGGLEFASTTGGVYAFYTTDLQSPRSVALGVDHHCVVESDGDVACWGRNTSGQLGNGTTSHAGLPVFVSAP